MKKKALLSSILALAICLCLIVGSTYALFTSKSELNVDVSSGTVSVVADLENVQLHSVVADPAGEEEDENGNTYTYVARTDGFFANRGTAVFENSVLTMTNITPGDKVSFTLTVANTSNVLAQYRYGIYCTSGQYLMSGMIVTIGGTAYPALDHYVTAWDELDPMEPVADVEISVELPVSAGNEYQSLSTSFYILVEAVQANGVVEGDAEIGYISAPDTVEELKDAINDPNVAYVAVPKDIEGVAEVGDVANKIIDAAGNNIALKFTGTMDNVKVMNIVNDGAAGTSINLKKATGDITVEDCALVSGSGTGACAIALGPNANITLKNSDISAEGTGKIYGMYNSGPSGSIIVDNCTFSGFTSWAITANSTVNGDVAITNCTFNATSGGVFKTLGGGITGTFTFTDNTMNCPGHDNDSANLVVSGSNPVVAAGGKTVTGNTLNGADWSQNQ